MPDLHVDVSTEADVLLPNGFDSSKVVSLAEHVLREESAVGFWSLAIRFVSDLMMQQMHVEFMGVDSPTDIMTFPYDESGWPVADTDRADTPARGGDLVISVDRAADNAADAGWTPADELRFLVCHGLLHLLGWNDDRPAGRESMLARQRTLLESWRPHR